jgi:gliding motility-associated-like protein
LDLQPVVVGLTDNLTLSTIDPAPICEGSSVQLQVTSNGTSYSWSGGGGSDLSGTTIANPVASPNTSTVYTITATLGNCTKSEQVTVNVIPAPIPDAGANGNICFGQNYQLQASGGAIYTWIPATYLDDASIANPRSVKPEKTITYTLSVKDVNNCPSLITDEVTVNVTPPIQVFTSPVDTVVYAGDQFSLLAVIPGTDTSYTWTPSIGLSDPNISTPVVTALNTGDVMTYKVTATTSAGCQGEAYVTVKVYEGPDLYIPTAFTPNNDGKNDVFIPFPVGIKQLNYFRVFNRWGQQLYFTKTLNQGWDGTMNGVQQGSGVYIWMAEAITENGIIINKRGTITLIR